MFTSWGLEYKDTETYEETLRIEIQLMESPSNRTRTIYWYSVKRSEVNLSGETSICFYKQQSKKADKWTMKLLMKCCNEGTSVTCFYRRIQVSILVKIAVFIQRILPTFKQKVDLEDFF